MSEPLTLRPFRPEDYPRLAELENLWRSDPTTPEEIRREDERSVAGSIRLRLMACTPQGEIAGYAAADRWPDDHPGSWWTSVVLDRPWRGKNLAEPLFTEVRDFARTHGGTHLRDSVRDDDPGAIRFAERVGALRRDHNFESHLVLAEFDFERLTPLESRLIHQGFRMCSLPELGGQTPENLDRLYSLYVELESQMPGTYLGWQRPRESFEHEIRQDPAFREDGIFVALDGDAWVGLALVMWRPGHPAHHQATGTLPAYRGRGIAAGLKARAIRWAASIGAERLRTHNNSTNAPMLAINHKLGYQPEPGRYLYELEISPA